MPAVTYIFAFFFAVMATFTLSNVELAIE